VLKRLPLAAGHERTVDDGGAAELAVEVARLDELIPEEVAVVDELDVL